jgi:hypothetical protein
MARNALSMSLELWSTIASVGTFVVISATAIAAVIQLRHMRASNQIAILNDFRTTIEDPDFRPATDFLRTLPTRMEEPEFRAALEQNPLPPQVQPLIRLLRLYESLGTYVNRGMLDRDMVCDLWAPVVLTVWNLTSDTIVVMRRTRGPELMENFEYLALVSQRYLDRNPSVYPKDAPRIAPADKWAAQDATRPSTPTR